MMPICCTDQAPVPPLAYHRAQARLAGALHLDALTLITTLHLLALCRLTVRLAHRRCPPPLPASPGGVRARKLGVFAPDRPLSGWSAIVSQVALTYTAPLIVALA